MSDLILVTETGSDVPHTLARQHGIYLVPMHVTFGTRTVDDGTFPPSEIYEHYDRTGTLPKTSGCTPDDFKRVFDALHGEFPEKHILHLAYSAATTCSYQSAVVAAEGAPYITSIDTGHVSAGLAAIVLEAADFLEQNPALPVPQAVAAIEGLCRRTRMCFLPDDLEYLRAGGRVSNAACLGGRLLGLHPCIELLDGHLVAKKKYRGKLEQVAPAVIWEFSQRESLQKDRLTLLWSLGLPERVRCAAENEAMRCGFQSVLWVQTGGVITTHGGPSCFGVAGFAEPDDKS